MQNKQVLQYKGYLNTPLLWQDNAVLDMIQYQISTSTKNIFIENITLNKRLGKRVEQFVFNDLKQNSSCTILAENIQIKEGKRTIGELDCLFKDDKNTIHLEIVYKFYLYDKSAGTTPLAHWIGPNRNDSLLKKIEKLKHKQFPLCYHPETKKILEELTIIPSEIKQYTYFKAQLFVPLTMPKEKFSIINNNCIVGFYCNQAEIQQFKTSLFYIPSKMDWLATPYDAVAWLSFDDYILESSILIKKQLAPLCWIKKSNGVLQKFFLTWW